MSTKEDWIEQLAREVLPADGQGRRQLAVETSKWGMLTGAIARILATAEQEGKS